MLQSIIQGGGTASQNAVLPIFRGPHWLSPLLPTSLSPLSHNKGEIWGKVGREGDRERGITRRIEKRIPLPLNCLGNGWLAGRNIWQRRN